VARGVRPVARRAARTGVVDRRRLGRRLVAGCRVAASSHRTGGWSLSRRNRVDVGAVVVGEAVSCAGGRTTVLGDTTRGLRGRFLRSLSSCGARAASPADLTCSRLPRAAPPVPWGQPDVIQRGRSSQPVGPVSFSEVILSGGGPPVAATRAEGRNRPPVAAEECAARASWGVHPLSRGPADVSPRITARSTAAPTRTKKPLG
jgi:hypothetical protein